MSSEVHADPAAIDAAQWNALLECRTRRRPSCATSTWPRCTLRQRRAPTPAGRRSGSRCEHDGALAAACALYLKSHSYGEYVFDWAWADAYERHGLPTTRSCWARCRSRRCRARACWRATTPARDAAAAGDAGDRAQAAGCRRRTCCSSTTPTARRCERAGLDDARRRAVPLAQPRAAPMPTSTSSCAACSATSARRSSRSGAAWPRPASTFTVHRGAEIDAPPWDFFYRCYTLTYRAHHSTPYLTRALLRGAWPRTMPEHWLMFVARRRGARRARR